MSDVEAVGRKSPAPPFGGKYLINGLWVNADGESLDPGTQAQKLLDQIAQLQARHAAMTATPEPSEPNEEAPDKNAPPPQTYAAKKIWAAENGATFPGNISEANLDRIIAELVK